MSEVRTVTTRRGIDAKVRVRGERGNPALVYLHASGGPFPPTPMRDPLADPIAGFAPQRCRRRRHNVDGQGEII